MLALGLSLVVSVAATSPPAAAHERLASSYDDAYCDPADGGECDDDPLVEYLPAPALILDCESPLIAGMIGSCDLPAPSLPTLHVPTLRTGSGVTFGSAPSSSGQRLTFVAPPSSVDAAISDCTLSLHPAQLAGELVPLHQTHTQDAPPSRLDRPPRV